MKTSIEMQTILKELYNISGFRISLHDTRMVEVAAYPPQLSAFCEFIQQNKECRRICVANDSKAAQIVNKSGETYLYRCPFGLYEAIAPLYQFGVLSGYLVMGQTLDTLNDSRDYVYHQSSSYVSDKEMLRHHIEHIPSCSRDKILSCISIMRICADYLTLSNRMNLSNHSLAHEIKVYINEHFHEKISIEQLSKHFFCSPPTLMRTFKKSYHKTVSRYLTEVRLAQATELLTLTKLSIRQIAENCGFSDQNYFTKVFVKEYNQTPRDYRKLNQVE